MEVARDPILIKPSSSPYSAPFFVSLSASTHSQSEVVFNATRTTESRTVKQTRAIRGALKKLPPESEEVLPGVCWGSCGQLYTPSFWKMQHTLYALQPAERISLRLGETILEEITACLLGGYGIPAEVGLMAFHRLKAQDLIRPGVKFTTIKHALSGPFVTSGGKTITYRFYVQKNRYLASLFQRLDLKEIPACDDMELREWLLTVDGIGPKTASWVTRNWLGV